MKALVNTFQKISYKSCLILKIQNNLLPIKSINIFKHILIMKKKPIYQFKVIFDNFTYLIPNLYKKTMIHLKNCFLMRGRLSFGQNAIRSFFSENGKSYQSRKAAKRLQKEGDIFKPEYSQLLEKQLSAQFLVPNFFTSTLTMRRFNYIDMGSKSVNSFLNSYACLYLPLSSNIKLREKLNKLFDNQVRTGRIFQIMDSVAGLVSYQHCYGAVSGQTKNPMICVTGSIESFFMFQKIDIKQDLHVSGYLNAVGKTSMEIEIYLQQEGKLKASSIFTMIARNAENPAQGYPVPTLDFSHLNPEDKNKALLRQASAKQNALRRKIDIENSYDRKSPSQAQIDQIHQIFLARRHSSVSRINITPIGNTMIQNCQIMHTQERNVHGKIFGGFLIREMLEIGWVAACKYAQDYVLIEDLTNIYFKRPVDIGSRLTLKSRITYVQSNRMVIAVEAYTAKFTDKKQTLACTLQLIAKSSKKPQEVYPDSYEQALLYLSSKKAYIDLFY